MFPLIHKHTAYHYEDEVRLISPDSPKLFFKMVQDLTNKYNLDKQ